MTPVRTPPVDAWLQSVEAELKLRAAAESWPDRLRLDTIYVGGGTPSLLGPGAMDMLREALQRFAAWDAELVEWTAEANPESFTPGLARDWRAAGVNRVSLGAQTFHEPSLRWMGRMHGPAGPGRAVAAARDAGLDDVSIDLIFGLPARLGRDWAADLERALELRPTHVSLYGLTAEPATPLGRHVRAGREQLADEEIYEAEYLLAAQRLGEAGYRHYEVSNFALPGRESRHNSAYWRHSAYVGIGPGAHSFAPPVRSWNVRDWAEYSRRVLAGTLPRAGYEELGTDDVALERIWLRLRTADGLPAAGLTDAQRSRIREWRSAGWADAGSADVGRDGVIRLTQRGWLLLDRLAVDLEAASG